MTFPNKDIEVKTCLACGKAFQRFLTSKKIHKNRLARSQEAIRIKRFGSLTCSKRCSRLYNYVNSKLSNRLKKETARAIFEELTQEGTIWQAIGFLSVSGENGKRMSEHLDKILNSMQQKYLGDAT